MLFPQNQNSKVNRYQKNNHWSIWGNLDELNIQIQKESAKIHCAFFIAVLTVNERAAKILAIRGVHKLNFHIGGSGSSTIHDAICELASKSNTISIAVSYIQMSGWELLKATLTEKKIKSLRILCTDQLGITDPNAVREIIKSGAAIRVFTGNVVFHPKVYIGTTKGTSDIFLMGSANLSRSALISGVEADLAGEDSAGKLKIWFDGLFDDNSKSANFDEDRLTALDLAFSSRTKSRIAFKRFNKSKIQPENQAESTVDDASIMESIFSNLELGTTPLNFDKAGNNIRRLGMIFDVLHGTRDLVGKTRS
jgi:HKD family nuclease